VFGIDKPTFITNVIIVTLPRFDASKGNKKRKIIVCHHPLWPNCHRAASFRMNPVCKQNNWQVIQSASWPQIVLSVNHVTNLTTPSSLVT